MREVLTRATVYLEPGLHRALRVKAAAVERTISDLVNDAVRRSLAEDAEDLATIDARLSEPDIAYEVAVKDLKKRGKL